MRIKVARMAVVTGAVAATAVLGLGSAASASTQERSNRAQATQLRDVPCHKADYCGPYGSQPEANAVKWALIDHGEQTGPVFYESDPLVPRGTGWYVYWF